MKIAVIGVYYASNLGDAIICDCVAFWLKKKWPSASIDIIDIENKKEFAKQTDTSLRTLEYRSWKLKWEYWQTKHHIKDWMYYWNKTDVESRREFYKQIAEKGYDAAVFAGGQIFMDWLSMDLAAFLHCFEKAKTPVYLNACGVGISISSQIRDTLRQYLLNDNVKLISTRDNQKEIEKLYVNHQKKVSKTYDPALWTREVYPSVPKLSTNIVGLGVMYSNHAPLSKITGFWMQMIKQLSTKGLPWTMFCNGSIDDYYYAAYILKKAGLKQEEYLYDCAQRPDELVQQIASFRSLISFRLHSHIVATSFHIPAIAVVWDEKLRFYYRNLGHEERCKTIWDKPDSVLQALEIAENEGYDIDLIKKQKKFARQLLLESLDGEEHIEQR